MSLRELAIYTHLKWHMVNTLNIVPVLNVCSQAAHEQSGIIDLDLGMVYRPFAVGGTWMCDLGWDYMQPHGPESGYRRGQGTHA